MATKILYETTAPKAYSIIPILLSLLLGFLIIPNIYFSESFGLKFFGLPITLYFFIKCIYAIYHNKKARFYITSNMFGLESGILTKEHIEVELKRIDTIYVRQNATGQMFNYGEIEINTAGSQYVYYVENPFQLKKQLDLIKSKNESLINE